MASAHRQGNERENEDHVEVEEEVNEIEGPLFNAVELRALGCEDVVVHEVPHSDERRPVVVVIDSDRGGKEHREARHSPE